MMKRILVTAAIMAALVAPAASQMGNQGKVPTPLDLQYEKERQEQLANEKAYNDQMKRLKAQGPTNSKTDPWAGVRPSTDTNATNAKR